MRREELGSQDDDFFREVAHDCPVGYLTLLTAVGQPRSVALNFAAVDGDIYFHGALAGEKHDLLARRPQVGFTMVKAYSYIPSYWSTPDHACPATQFFKSIEINGQGDVVSDAAGKARALQALMAKHQPEGGFTPLTAELPMYRGSLRTVGIFRVQVASWTGKLKFGQNEPARLRRLWVTKLRERGEALDLATAAEIERTFTGAD